MKDDMVHVRLPLDYLEQIDELLSDLTWRTDKDIDWNKYDFDKLFDAHHILEDAIKTKKELG